MILALSGNCRRLQVVPAAATAKKKKGQPLVGG